MQHPVRPGRMAAAMAAIGLAWIGAAQAQESKSAPDPEKRVVKGEMKSEQVAGVILKVEDLPAGAPPREGSRKKSAAAKQGGAGKRLTVNTAVVWDDWVRDQPTDAATAKPESAAKEGANSIGTKGQPQAPEAMITVDVYPNTTIETRYRASTDQAGEGARTPAGAVEADKDPADTTKSSAPAVQPANQGEAGQVDLAGLKPGIWVEVEYRHRPSQNRASRVVVLRPVGGPQSPAAEAVPAAKAADPKK